MTDHPNAATARATMSAFNRGDMETFAAALADDVVWHAPGKNRFSGDFVGKAAALGRFQEQAAAGVSLHSKTSTTWWATTSTRSRCSRSR
jgi:ketosteroid isomerase-like protein